MTDPGYEPPVEELAEEAVEHNPDPTTRREALELDLEDRGRSEDGEEIDIESDVDSDVEQSPPGDSRRAAEG